MNSRYIPVVASFLVSFLVGAVVWSGIFKAQLPNTSRPELSKSYSDKLSGEEVTTESINNVTKTNPQQPSFVGFDKFATFDVSTQEEQFIRDFLTNYVLYKKHANAAIISLVNNTFSGPTLENEGFVRKYSFSFGINGGDVHKADVVVNVTKTITITISKSGQTEDTKTFSLQYTPSS